MLKVGNEKLWQTAVPKTHDPDSMSCRGVSLKMEFGFYMSTDG